MTNVLFAAVIVAYIAIALLVLGYAGLVAQLRALQSRAASPQPQVNPELASSGDPFRTVALVLTSSCATCELVFPVWLELAPVLRQQGDRAVLVSLDGATQWAERGATDVYLPEDLSSGLLIAYQPALLLFDYRGALVSADPVGSVESLRAKYDALLTPSLPQAGGANEFAR